MQLGINGTAVGVAIGLGPDVEILYGRRRGILSLSIFRKHIKHGDSEASQ